MPNLRLCRETDTIEDPPAPLPFNASSWRTTEGTSKENTMDSIEFAQSALADAEAKMEALTEVMNEEIESYSIAQWTDPNGPNDDDGPFAA